jgi:uncharacterized membrane protein YkgB
MNTNDKNQTSFVTKIIIVTIAIIAIVSFLLPDTGQLKNLDTPLNKIYALSFIQNPEALYMASEHWESQKKYDNAIRDMRLAVGLLEMNHADNSVISRYRNRLDVLKSNH